MPNKKSVLVTGLSGAVGQAINGFIKDRYEISSLSRNGVKNIPKQNNHKGDIGSLDSIVRFFHGIDTVVHLAADGGVRSINGMNADWNSILQSNIIGTYNVFEASVRAGVKRVIFASSGSTIMGYETMYPYSDLLSGKIDPIKDSIPFVTHESEPQPRSFYSVSKLFGEDLARMYSAIHNISIICIRIGGCSLDGKPSPGRGKSIFVSHRDIAQLIIKSIEAPKSLKFDIFFGVSNNKLRYRDLIHSKEVLGYIPQDSAEKF